MHSIGVSDGYVARLVEIVELPLQFRYGEVYHLDIYIHQSFERYFTNVMQRF